LPVPLSLSLAPRIASLADHPRGFINERKAR
jgi:hypothetical protein